MQVRRIVLVAAAVLLLGGGTALAGVDTVYVTYPNMDAIYSWSTTPNSTPSSIYGATGSSYEDMVVGPDNRLYACDPAGGDIVRMNLDGSGVVFVYSYDGTDDLVAPQCGWFTHRGDLIVTDKSAGSGVWYVPGLAYVAYGAPTFPSPVRLVGSDDLGTSFVGGGVTQEADGDLLIVDQAGGRVIRLGFDVNADYPDGTGVGWFNPNDLNEFFITGLAAPIGIARSSRGDIFVAALDGVHKYSYDGDGVIQSQGECPDLGVGNRERPYFLEFAADDTLYISMTRKNSTELIEVPPDDCFSWVALSEVPKRTLEPPVVGMAVPYFADNLDDRFIAGKLVTDPDLLPDPDAQVFTFYDHAYEFKAEPSGCEVLVSAAETTRSELQDLADLVPITSYEPDYPGCLDEQNPTWPCASLDAIFTLGKDGRGILYDVIPDPDVNPGPCYAQPGEILFRHAINAYAGYIPNPRLVRCFIPQGVTDYTCELIDLNTYFPFNGVLPDDTRVGSTRTSSSSDFSRYFLVDLDLNNNDNGDGFFCGFETPFTNPPVPDDCLGEPCDGYNDPDILYGFYTDGPYAGQNFVDLLPEFSTTETAPFKFKIAEASAAVGCDPKDPASCLACISGPYIANATVLMSIARLREYAEPPATGLEPVFVPTKVYSAGSSAIVDPAIFNEAANPTKTYHFNAKFPFPPYKAGVYQIVLVPLTDNFAAEVRYFKVAQ